MQDHNYAYMLKYLPTPTIVWLNVQQVAPIWFLADIWLLLFFLAELIELI